MWTDLHWERPIGLCCGRLGIQHQARRFAILRAVLQSECSNPYFADETTKPPKGKMMELGLKAGRWGLSKPRVFRRPGPTDPGLQRLQVFLLLLAFNVRGRI